MHTWPGRGASGAILGGGSGQIRSGLVHGISGVSC